MADRKRRSFRVHGVWQRPGDSRRIPGTLSFSPGTGLILRLIIDDLEAPLPQPGPIEISPSDVGGLVMTGVTSDNRYFTLWDGFMRRGNPWSHLFRSVGEKELFFNRGFEGIYEPEPKQLRFSRANARINMLSCWLAQAPVRVEFSDLRTEKPAKIYCSIPDDQRYGIDEARTLLIGWSAQGPSWRVIQTSASVAVRPYLAIEYTEPKDLAVCQADLIAVGDLIQLLSGHAVVCRELTFHSPSAVRTLEGGVSFHQQLRFLASELKQSDAKQPSDPYGFLFSFPHVDGRFREFLRSWWNIYRANEHVLSSYFSVAKWRGSFADERFFVAASAAEAVHEILNPKDRSLTTAQWKAVRTSLARALPDELRDHILPKLSHLPRLTFAERIEALIAALPDVLRHQILGDTAHQSLFVQRVRNLRNAKAHQLKLKHRTSGIELVRITSKLRVLIDWALLGAIGIEAGEFAAAIERSASYKFYAFNQTWPWDDATVD